MIEQVNDNINTVTRKNSYSSSKTYQTPTSRFSRVGFMTVIMRMTKYVSPVWKWMEHARIIPALPAEVIYWMPNQNNLISSHLTFRMKQNYWLDWKLLTSRMECHTRSYSTCWSYILLRTWYGRHHILVTVKWSGILYHNNVRNIIPTFYITLSILLHTFWHHNRW